MSSTGLSSAVSEQRKCPLRKIGPRLTDTTHSERMYKSRLAAWKFSKNSTDTEYQTSAVLHKMHILAQRARINTAADQEWIMNLARHFKDRSEREKFFVTYEERDYVLGEGILDNDQEALVHPKQPNKQVATSLTRVSVPITCNGSDTNALPDTGVVLNVMSHAYALGSGLTVDTDAKKQHTFSNAKGRCFTSIGETTARIGIKDGLTPPQEVTFSIVERLPSDLILGRMFLTAAGLLKAFKDRVRRVAVPVAKEFFRVMRMDATSHRLLCQVDGNDVPAYADTGSDVDLVSLEYAIRRHWTIKRTPSHQGQVLLSDGTIEDLEGYVERTISVAGTQTTRRFHVLNGLTCDVLLGNEFIHDLDVWNNHAESLIEVEAGDSYDLYNIEWVGCFNKIEQEVEALLQAKPPPTTGRGRFGLIDRLSRKSNSGSGQQIKSALEQRLYEIDFVESRHEQLARIRISLLAGAGDTYHSEVFQDEQRRLHWTTLRAKVLDLRNRIQADRSLAPPTTV